MIKKYPVILIFIDENENYEKSLSLIGKEMYQDVKNFENFEDLRNFLENPENQSFEVLLFIHVFRNDGLKGFNHANKNLIRREFPNLDIHWVTSDKPGATGELIKQTYNTYRYDDIADLIDNGKLIPKKVSILKYSNLNIENMEKEFIFISHSSNDKKIVTSFFENVLRLGLDISKGDVFYSSHPSTGISTGLDIPDSLKEALQKMTLFIQYVSNDYKMSEVCLNEMGAAWLKLPKNRIITLKAPDLGFNELGFINVQRIGLCINKRDDLLGIIRDYKSLFNFDPVDFVNKVEKFLKDNGF
jgi:hypothetical protein